MSSPLAAQTIARLQQALRTREAASLPEVIRLIEELSSRAFSISVQELADLIGRDTIVTAKVIKAANTFGYNPCGIAVTTVSGAIQVVGFNKVRNLALSMLLLDNAAHPSHSDAQRESAAQALCGGLIAQTVVAARPDQDSEQAFVFGCLRHYGRLLLTTFFGEDWLRVAQRPPNESEPDACRRVFGLSPLELTQQMFETSRLPKPILRCLQDLSSGQLAIASANSEDHLAAVTQFSAAVSEAVMSPRLGAVEFAQQSEKICTRFQNRIAIAPDGLRLVVTAVDQSLRSFQRTYGAQSIGQGVLQRLAARTAPPATPLPEIPNEFFASAQTPAPVASSPPPTATGLASGNAATSSATAATVAGASAGSTAPVENAPPAAAVPTPLPESVPPPVTLDGAAILTEALLQLTELMSAVPIDLRQMDTVVLSAVKSALRLRDCVWFSRAGTAGTLSARSGFGDLLTVLKDRPLLSADRRDVFGICLVRREDVLIRDTSDEKLRPFLPDWLMSAGMVGSFILLPLQDSHGVFAMILGTRAVGDPLHSTPRELQLLKAIRQHLTSARRLSTSGA